MRYLWEREQSEVSWGRHHLQPGIIFPFFSTALITFLLSSGTIARPLGRKTFARICEGKVFALEECSKIIVTEHLREVRGAKQNSEDEGFRPLSVEGLALLQTHQAMTHRWLHQ